MEIQTIVHVAIRALRQPRLPLIVILISYSYNRVTMKTRDNCIKKPTAFKYVLQDFLPVSTDVRRTE